MFKKLKISLKNLGMILVMLSVAMGPISCGSSSKKSGKKQNSSNASPTPTATGTPYVAPTTGQGGINYNTPLPTYIPTQQTGNSGLLSMLPGLLSMFGGLLGGSGGGLGSITSLFSGMLGGSGGGGLGGLFGGGTTGTTNTVQCSSYNGNQAACQQYQQYCLWNGQYCTNR